MRARSASTRSSRAASAGRGRTVEIEWLDQLESRVRDAVARLGELNEENRSLRDRVRDLETEVATLSIPPAAPEGDGDLGEIDEEVEALRVRVRGLQARLAAADTERAAPRRRRARARRGRRGREERGDRARGGAGAAGAEKGGVGGVGGDNLRA